MLSGMHPLNSNGIDNHSPSFLQKMVGSFATDVANISAILGYGVKDKRLRLLLTSLTRDMPSRVKLEYMRLSNVIDNPCFCGAEPLCLLDFLDLNAASTSR
jgi:hypothetical protein